jgi:transglutaminase-like putative cysteine protease
MKLHILHRTTYRYASSASYSIQTLKLTPRRDATQRTLSWRLQAPGRRVEQIDAFGNLTHLMTLEGPHTEVSIQAEGVIETDDAYDGTLSDDNNFSPLVYVNTTSLTQGSEAIARLAASVFSESVATRDSARTLIDAVTEAVSYQPGTTVVSDTASEVMTRGEGVCQDQTHVAIAVCRAAGIPARYVSGYVFIDAAAQASSHAWVDVWLASESAWISCDLTHGTLAGPKLCRLAVGRDYLDAAPVRGVRRGGGREQLEVHVSVVDSATQQ